MPHTPSFFSEQPRLNFGFLLKFLLVIYGLYITRALGEVFVPSVSSRPMETDSLSPIGFGFSSNIILPQSNVVAACTDLSGNTGFALTNDSTSAPTLVQLSIDTREQASLAWYMPLPESISSQGTPTVTTDPTGRFAIAGVGSENLYVVDTHLYSLSPPFALTAPINAIATLIQTSIIVAAQNVGLVFLDATSLPTLTTFGTHSSVVGYEQVIVSNELESSYFLATHSAGIDVFELNPGNPIDITLSTSFMMEPGWSIVSTVLANDLIYALTRDSDGNGVLQILDPSQRVPAQTLPVPTPVFPSDTMTIVNGFAVISNRFGLTAYSMINNVLNAYASYPWNSGPHPMENPPIRTVFSGYDAIVFQSTGIATLIGALPQINSPTIDISLTGESTTFTLNDFIGSPSIVNLQDIQLSMPNYAHFALLNHPSGIITAADLAAGTVVAEIEQDATAELLSASFDVSLPHHADSSYPMQLNFGNFDSTFINPALYGTLLALALMVTTGFCFARCRGSRSSAAVVASVEAGLEANNVVDMDAKVADANVEFSQEYTSTAAAPEVSKLASATLAIKLARENLVSSLKDTIGSLDWFADDKIAQLKCNHVFTTQILTKMLDEKNTMCCPECKTETPAGEISYLQGIQPLVTTCKALVAALEDVSKITDASSPEAKLTEAAHSTLGGFKEKLETTRNQFVSARQARAKSQMLELSSALTINPFFTRLEAECKIIRNKLEEITRLKNTAVSDDSPVIIHLEDDAVVEIFPTVVSPQSIIVNVAAVENDQPGNPDITQPSRLTI